MNGLAARTRLQPGTSLLDLRSGCVFFSYWYALAMPMGTTFAGIESDNECRCLDGAKEGGRDTFCRRTWTSPPTTDDFKSYWELGKRPRSKPTQARYCKDLCGHKGVSVHKYTTQEELREHYGITRGFRPGPDQPQYYCRVRLRPEAGKVQHTPSNNDKLHHDVMKADGFSLDLIEIVGSGGLVDV